MMLSFRKLDGKEIITLTTKEIEQLVLDSNISMNHVNTKHYRIACPRCVKRNPDNRTHRNMSISSDFTVGYCFRCNLTIVDELHGSDKEVDSNIIEPFKYKTFEVIKINCDKMKQAQDISISPEGSEYIKNRNKYYDVISNQFNLKYKNGKIIIPYFDSNTEWYYYQFRYIDVSKSPTKSKYYNPPIDSKGLYLTCELDKKVHWDFQKPTILVEGALTAIALKLTVQQEANVVGLIGKTITDYQIQFLNKLGHSDIYVMMDETRLSEEVKTKLLKNNIESSIIESDGRDAEEMIMQQGIEYYRDYILDKITDTDIDLMFSLPKISFNKKSTFSNRDVKSFWRKEE